MAHNSRYTDHYTVMAAISRMIKNKPFQEQDIVEWCQFVELDCISKTSTMYTYIEVELEVNNQRAFLPCNLHRLLDVYTIAEDYTSRVPYTNVGSFISLDPDKSYDSVYIDYKGTPVDLDTGVPLIVRGHEDACVAYCVWCMYLEDIYDDKVSVDTKNRIEKRKDDAILAAKSKKWRYLDREDANKLMRIKFNMLPQPAGFKLIKTSYP
ncbi:MAG: hypothetical protein H8E51_08670 [Bacteroidetes bacterium]|nr:hypothetical protein [Bacteroidota bacterium]